MDIGLCTISNAAASVDAVCRHAETAGFDGIEVWGRDHVNDGSDAVCRQIRDAAATHDLSILTYGSYLRAGAGSFAADLSHELTVAEKLGADRIRVWAGTVEYGDHTDTHWDQTVTDLQQLTDLARSGGLQVTVEKHPGYLTNTARGAERLIDAVDDTACALNYQPMFSLSADEISAEIDRLAPLSNQLHLQAVPRRGDGGENRSPLSEAFFDVDYLVNRFLEAGGEEGSIHVEFVTDEQPYTEAISSDCAYLRSVLGEAEEAPCCDRHSL